MWGLKSCSIFFHLYSNLQTHVCAAGWTSARYVDGLFDANQMQRVNKYLSAFMKQALEVFFNVDHIFFTEIRVENLIVNMT